MPKTSFIAGGGKLSGMCPMMSEIREQPRLLEEQANPLLLQAENAAPAESPRVIVFVARGSSDNACLYGRYLFEIALGLPTSFAAPSVLTRYGATISYPPRCLFIGVSQSGAAPDVAAVLHQARENGHDTIAISNAPTGVVVDSASRVILLNAGEELSVPATKTFTLSLLALYQLCRVLGATLPEPGLAKPAAAMLEMDDPKEIGRLMLNESLIFSLARGYHYSIACEAALKLMECALIPCKPFSLADFAHGPIALAGPMASALIFGGDTGDETATDVRARMLAAGSRLWQAPVLDLPEELQPIPAAIFAQRVAFEAATARGLNPDAPRNLSKVTKTR
jgi:glucosamine--fructose-6-phosphate aminotransferase (isomerizing)